MAEKQYFIFKRNNAGSNPEGTVPTIPPDCGLHIWRPGLVRPVPSGLPIRKYPYFLFLRVVHSIDCLIGKGYVVYTVYRKNRLVHYSGLAPRCFKYPFMNKNDLIIGPVWTAAEVQRKGIAKAVIRKLLKDYAGHAAETFWYVTQEKNLESNQLIQACGFKKASKSTVARQLGLRIHTIGSGIG